MDTAYGIYHSGGQLWGVSLKEWKGVSKKTRYDHYGGNYNYYSFGDNGRYW